MFLVYVLLLLNYKKIEEPPATLARVMGAQCKKELQVGGIVRNERVMGLRPLAECQKLRPKLGGNYDYLCNATCGYLFWECKKCR